MQLRRTKGWRKPDGVVVVSRPTRWGNPFAVGDEGIDSRAAAVEAYRRWIAEPDQSALRDEIVAVLAGRDLACWCPLDGPCHADVLLAIANPQPG